MIAPALRSVGTHKSKGCLEGRTYRASRDFTLFDLCGNMSVGDSIGGGSLVAHQEQARVQGVVVRVYRLPGMEFDVDEPADLRRLQLMKPEFRDAEG